MPFSGFPIPAGWVKVLWMGYKDSTIETLTHSQPHSLSLWACPSLFPSPHLHHGFCCRHPKHVRLIYFSVFFLDVLSLRCLGFHSLQASSSVKTLSHARIIALLSSDMESYWNGLCIWDLFLPLWLHSKTQETWTLSLLYTLFLTQLLASCAQLMLSEGKNEGRKEGRRSIQEEWISSAPTSTEQRLAGHQVRTQVLGEPPLCPLPEAARRHILRN